MLFHTPDGVGEALACGICVAMSEGEIDPVPAGPAGDAGDPLGPTPTQPARPTVTRVSSAAPARRIRIRLDFAFMPYPALSTWLEVNHHTSPWLECGPPSLPRTAAQDLLLRATSAAPIATAPPMATTKGPTPTEMRATPYKLWPPLAEF